MSMGSFMPMPAPLMGGGGGGTVLDGTITVGGLFGVIFGWSDGTGMGPFGSISGDAAPYILQAFVWDPTGDGLGFVGGQAGVSVECEMSFQGDTYQGILIPELETYFFDFGPEVATWPTSGTHPFTLTLP